MRPPQDAGRPSGIPPDDPLRGGEVVRADHDHHDEKREGKGGGIAQVELLEALIVDKRVSVSVAVPGAPPVRTNTVSIT